MGVQRLAGSAASALGAARRSVPLISSGRLRSRARRRGCCATATRRYKHETATHAAATRLSSPVECHAHAGRDHAGLRALGELGQHAGPRARRKPASPSAHEDAAPTLAPVRASISWSRSWKAHREMLGDAPADRAPLARAHGPDEKQVGCGCRRARSRAHEAIVASRPPVRRPCVALTPRGVRSRCAGNPLPATENRHVGSQGHRAQGRIEDEP